MIRNLKIQKIVRKIYAKLMGYFWLPCELCGEMHGGMDTNYSIMHYASGHGISVCWECGEYVTDVSLWINDGVSEHIGYWSEKGVNVTDELIKEWKSYNRDLAK